MAGLVFILAMNIPLPGIDMAAISAQTSPDRGTLSRLSIFALGLMPLYTALILVELGRLLVRSDDGLPRQPGPIEKAIVAVIALSLTALQGYGIVGGLRQSGLVNGDTASLPVLIIATYMGVTALAVFLCYRIRIAGFRHAFWALWSIPVLLLLPYNIGAIAQMTRTGALPATTLLGVVAYFIVCVAAVVVMAALWKSVCVKPVGAAGEADFECVEPMEILIWPSVLAGMVVQLALTIMAFIIPGVVENWLESFLIVMPVISAVLIPVLVFAYIRRSRAFIRPGAPLAAVATAIALIQIVLGLADMVRMTLFPYAFGLGSTATLALTLTALSFARSGAGIAREGGAAR